MRSKGIAIVFLESIIIIVLVLALLSFYKIPVSTSTTPVAATIAPGDIVIQEVTISSPSTLSYSVSVKGGMVNMTVYDPHGNIILNKNIRNNTIIKINLSLSGDYRIVFVAGGSGQGYIVLAAAGSVSSRVPLGETPYSIVAGLLFIPLGISIGIIINNKSKCGTSTLPKE